MLFLPFVHLQNMHVMQSTEKKYLPNIDSPDDLKRVPRQELPLVCAELRQFIIDELSHNPGHLASSLGVVELSVALHYVFNTPYDRIIWDVGHQAYGHKILTGRRDRFHTNRQFKGLSGFPSPKESPYDAFGTGHSSTSISAGLGMSVAAELQHERDRHVVAVIGDGAMTGGLAFEGLNNTSMDKNNLLIILNDNQMAIDPLKGGFTQYLVDINTSSTYNRFRHQLYVLFSKLHIMNENRRRRLLRFNTSLKTMLTRQQHNIFEGLNIRYFGPVDGHAVDDLVRIMSEIKNYKGPKVLHVITKKGKGYKPAEDSVTIWHAPGEFNVETGERKVADDTRMPPLFQDVFGKTLLELARKNEKIVGITPAMPSGCSMTIMQHEMPERVFDVGIAEGHAVTFSAGLAKEGIMPFCNIYSSFMQRAYDNIIHDVALQGLDMVLCIDRAGIVGADGATHHGLFDLAYLRCIPNMTIASPLDEVELRNLMFTAQLPGKGPFAIRYPRGRGITVDWERPMQELPVGKGRCLKSGSDMAVISIGFIGNTVAEAIRQLEQERNVSIAHYDIRFLKPIDTDLLHEVGKNFRKVITVEDGVISGGLGSAVLEFMADNGYHPDVVRLGVRDQFVEHGSTRELYHMLGLDTEGLKNSMAALLSRQGQNLDGK